MAKYLITHICGHEEKQQIFGTNTHGERQRKADWLASTLCSTCYKAERDAQRKAEIAETEAANALPELVGSEKQISWAKDIRQKMLQDKFGLDGYKKHWIHIKTETSAKWFIDNR